MSKWLEMMGCLQMKRPEDCCDISLEVLCPLGSDDGIGFEQEVEGANTERNSRFFHLSNRMDESVLYQYVEVFLERVTLTGVCL